MAAISLFAFPPDGFLRNHEVAFLCTSAKLRTFAGLAELARNGIGCSLARFRLDSRRE